MPKTSLYSWPLLLTLACGSPTTSQSTTTISPTPPPVKTAPARSAPKALVGAALPHLPLVGLDGEEAMLGASEQKATILVLWSTWCQSCLHETAQLTEWAKVRTDVRLVSVNVDGLTGDPPNPAKIRKYAKELGLQQPIWTLDAKHLPSLGIKTCPTSFIVDVDGKVVAARQGYKGPAEMNTWLDMGLRTL